MKKKLVLDDIQLESFVTSRELLAGHRGIDGTPNQPLSLRDGCVSPLCVSDPVCSFEMCYP